MSVIRRAAERRSLPPSIDPYGITARPSIPNWTGELVNETTAMSVSTVMACVSLIADSVASMQLRAFDQSSGKMSEIDVPAWLRAPNERQSQFSFLSELTAAMALHGNGFVFVQRGRRRDIIALENLHPLAVLLSKDPSTGAVKFQAMGRDLGLDEVVHLPWLTVPQRVLGISPIEAQRTTIGLALAMERHLAQWYGEGGIPSSVIEADSGLSVDSAQRLAEAWQSNNWRHRKTAVLPSGLKWRSTQVSASDMEMQASREHQVLEICRAYRVPPFMVGAKGDPSVYQNVEQASIYWIRNGLLGWMSRIEQGLSRLMPFGQVVRFDATQLMRGDRAGLAKAQQVEIASGTLSPNEARAEMGRDPYDGGDAFYIALAGAAVPPVGEDADGASLATPGID